MKLSVILRLIVITVLIGAFFNMPYSYLEDLRIVVFICCGILAYLNANYNQVFKFPICVIIGILYNPFIKFHYAKSQWETIDIVIIAGILIWLSNDFWQLLGKRQKKKNLEIQKMVLFKKFKENH